MILFSDRRRFESEFLAWAASHEPPVANCAANVMAFLLSESGIPWVDRLFDTIEHDFEPLDPFTWLLYGLADIYPTGFPRWWWLDRLQATLSTARFLKLMAMVAKKREREGASPPQRRREGRERRG